MKKNPTIEHPAKELPRTHGDAAAARNGTPLAMVRKAAKRIRFAALREAAQRQAILQASAQFSGHLDSIDHAVITGWAWDERQPRVSVALEIFDGERRIGAVIADDYRDDLKAVGIGDGYHAFSFKMPGELADGGIHLIDIRFAGTDIRLSGAPLRVSIAKAGFEPARRRAGR